MIEHAAGKTEYTAEGATSKQTGQERVPVQAPECPFRLLGVAKITSATIPRGSPMVGITPRKEMIAAPIALRVHF